MSPFFRGNVRPVKKHPRPWSLNPRLNPDAGKDDARLSMVGLPSADTDLALPVFNHTYATRHSLPQESRKSVVVAADHLEGGARPDHLTKIVEPTEPRGVHDTVPRDAETARVAEPGFAGSTDDVVATTTTTATTTHTDAAQTQPPVITGTQESGTQPESPLQAPALDRHEKQTVPPAPSDPAPAPRTLAPEAGSKTVGGEVQHQQQQQPDVVATAAPTGAGLETTEGEVKPEVFAGSSPPPAESPLPAIDEEDPATAAAVEDEASPVVLGKQGEAGGSTSSGLEAIVEEEREPEAEAPLRGREEALAAEITTLNLRGGERSGDGVAGSVVFSSSDEGSLYDEHDDDDNDDDDADATPEGRARHRAGTFPGDADPAEAPFVPRHSVILPGPPTGGFGGDEDNDASTPGADSFAESGATSREGSVLTNEEPLMLDEQLEFGDEFRPGVKTFSGLMGIRTMPVESVSQQY